jgi:hypothetical protein
MLKTERVEDKSNNVDRNEGKQLFADLEIQLRYLQKPEETCSLQ